MAIAAKDNAIRALDIEVALADRCAMHSPPSFFMTQVKNGPTQYVPADQGLLVLDGLSIDKSWTKPCISGYEIKISRGDFLRDTKWYQYFGYVHEFYLVCPSGIIDRTEIPLECGLMYYRPESGTIVMKKKAVHRDVTPSADMLMYIIMSKLDSDRLPFFSSKKVWVEEYLKDQSSSHQLGRSLATKLPQRLAELECEIDRLHNAKDAMDELEAIKDVCEKHNVRTWYGTAKGLDEALTVPFPREIERIREDAQGILNIIEDMKKEEPEVTV
jgi:hypothetical protein